MNTITPSSMEPILPSEAARDELSDIALDLISKNERLLTFFHPITQTALSEMLRTMNCYYSNLIEGHNTHPIDIERALKKDFSHDPIKRNLQLEARAHIHCQSKIDNDTQLNHVTSAQYFLWLHKEFCSLLPEELLWVENPQTHERKKVIPGKFRDGTVIVGQHIPIEADRIPSFLTRFEEGYNPSKLNRIEQMIAVAASHHRFLWIHPFYDGNGRVARLYSHAYFKKIGLGNGLWSISRGLAREHVKYKELLMNADSVRQGDYDGRGALTQKGLNEFCVFFLKTCIDQIEFMEKLLHPDALLKRIERWTQQKIDAKVLLPGSFALLKAALLEGEFERGKASLFIQEYKERQARTVLKQLIQQGYLTSNSPKGPVRIVFSSATLEDWFPKLY